MDHLPLFLFTIFDFLLLPFIVFFLTFLTLGDRDVELGVGTGCEVGGLDWVGEVFGAHSLVICLIAFLFYKGCLQKNKSGKLGILSLKGGGSCRLGLCPYPYFVFRGML